MAEYSLVLGLVALALVAVIGQFRGALSGAFTRTTSTLVAAADNGSSNEGGRGSCGAPPCGRGPDGQGPPGSSR